MQTYLYTCQGCGCPRSVPVPPQVDPPDAMALYCACCHQSGNAARTGLPHGAQVFRLTPAAPVAAEPASQPEPPYAYQHPTDRAEQRRWTFARYLYETGRIREGYGAAEN